MTNHSQNREQEVILNYFGDFKGTFCDVGCNDGITLSNTRALAELDWCGCLIDPSPKAFFKLKTLYSETKGCFYLYNFAIGTKNGTLEFHESGTHLGKGDVGLLSTSDPEEMKRFPGTQYEKIDVKVFRWKTALNRFGKKRFDMISLDAEGVNLDILKQIDLSHTKLLVVEFNGDLKLKAEYDKLTEGFTVIYTSPENIIYAR